jgi:hypothetical protein
MPRIKVQIPDPLLQVAADQAHAAGKKIDELYEAAIGEFVANNKHTRAGAVRNRGGMPMSSPRLTIEIPEKLFQEAEALCKRLGKRRDAIYSLALARHVNYEANAPSALDQGHTLPEGASVKRRQSALDQGHDLPSGAWRPKQSG